jgi:hypothetical protein
MTTFWDVAPCSLVKETDVSEVRTASIIRAMMEATWRMPCLFLAEAQTIFAPLTIYKIPHMITYNEENK